MTTSADEQHRVEAERARHHAETARHEAEEARQTAEDARVAAEAARAAAETARDALVEVVRSAGLTLAATVEQMRVVEEMRRSYRDLKDRSQVDP